MIIAYAFDISILSNANFLVNKACFNCFEVDYHALVLTYRMYASGIFTAKSTGQLILTES